MEVKTFMLIYLCFTCLFPAVGSVPIKAALKIGAKVYNVVEFGMSVMGIIDNLKSGETPSDLSEIIDEVSAKIDASTTAIIKTVTLQSKLDRIDDAVINIHSSLIDLKHILQATTKKDRDQYIQLFAARFEEHHLVKHLRFLPELLEYTIPGTTGKLVDLFADQSRCNMTAIYAFRTFYIELISDGISLELLYLKLSTDVSINEVLEQWNPSLVKIGQIFETQETKCKSKFEMYAEEDLRNANDALKLWTDNKIRYTWKTSDVIFLKPYGTLQFLYYSHRCNSLFWHRTNRNKFAIFSDKDQTKPNLKILQNVEGKLKASIQGEWDENAAKNVGNAIENHLKDKGYIIISLIVFFEGGDISSERIKVDTNSPVIQLSIGDVKLRYCYESGFECKVDFFNWFGGKKSVYGRMRAFAYTAKANGFENCQELKTGSSTQNEPFIKLVYILLILCLEVLRKI
ncbi:uncharacterized protein LOC123539153 [Mercenaria mercenaria]|uniref:uncharacterized protein LOC123539153 n=1 Tax=Mercenaria mercenaria TaxID=6596 RepID=UPI00234E5E2A|nr:uncharacterized protein LOC123539153 [Mercenaria mercenaria]